MRNRQAPTSIMMFFFTPSSPVFIFIYICKALTMTNVRFLMTSNADVAEFVATYDSKITRKPVKDLGLPHGVTIGGLMRDGKGMLVSGMTQIKAGDSVMVFSHDVNLRKIEKLFR